MPDISMCRNKKCNKKSKCYRYIAKASLIQSYSSFDENNTDTCFVKIQKNDIITDNKMLIKKL